MAKREFFKRRDSFLWIVCSSFLLLTTHCSFGQDLYSRVDSMRVDEQYLVLERFSYIIERKDTVKQGKYELLFKPYVKDTFLNRSYQYEQLQLNFINNTREGPFLLRSFSFTPSLSRFSPEGGELRIPFSGTNSELKGQYGAGRPTGQWYYGRYRHPVKAPADTLLMLTTSFSGKGVPAQQFRIIEEDLKIEISGEFNEEGSLDGMLRMQNREGGEPTYSYRFEEGLLTGITGPEGTLVQPQYTTGSSTELNIQEHALDSLFPKVVSYYLPEIAENEKSLLLRPLRVLAQAFADLSAPSGALTEYLPGELNIQAPTVKLPVYEPDGRETAFIQETYQRLSSLQNMSDSLMHVSAFSLNRYSDKELASLYARAQLLLNRVSRQRRIFEVLSGPLQQHINPEWFMSRRLGEISLQDTLTYTFNDEQIEEEVEFQFSRDDLSPLEQYQAYVLRLEEMYTSISRQMRAKLQEQHLDSRLQEREEQITALSEQMEKLADSLELNLYTPEISSAYKNSFVAFKETLLQQYAQTPASERGKQTQYIIECLERLQSRLREAKQLSQQEIAVDLAYTDNRLNPYTYTEMRVRLYERLFRTYQETLVPYLVEKMLPAESCEDFLQRANNLHVLQDFMLEALTKNPGRIDRRVRPQESPEAIIRKLGIPVVLK